MWKITIVYHVDILARCALYDDKIKMGERWAGSTIEKRPEF